jgi:hypothetical protein
MPKPKAGSVFGGLSRADQATREPVKPSTREPKGEVPSYRVGKKNLACWLPEAAVRQIKAIAAEEGVTVQEKMAEIVNREFARKGRPELA